jgi:hypothetical protein
MGQRSVLSHGSVPTLWDVLNPETRPRIWRRITDDLNESKVGLSVETVDRIPLTQTDMAVRRQYFDTTRFGKSNRGHDYPSVLNDDEKRAVLEYLKTL